MIPSTNNILSTTLTIKKQPSKNHKLYMENDTISGVCNDLEAMKQVIYKILNTERYQCIMYSWNYGIELYDLFGEPTNYVISELRRRITEALVQDDRIDKVDGFEFNIIKKRTVNVKFTVHTIFGDIREEKAVDF